MIRYPITLAELTQLVDALDAKAGRRKAWTARAEEALAKCREAGHFVKGGEIWSDVKPVYKRLQRNKCCFCERQLASERYGKIEHDVEHFRPKSEVRGWADPSLAGERLGFAPPAVGQTAPGYHLLAYHLLNYATSCKTCNTPLKGNAFPIAGRRQPHATDPLRLAGERPYLLYPIGISDEDPSDLIEFAGLSPRPRPRLPLTARRRALVTIAFFRLHDAAGREDLFRGRAEAIDHLWLALELRTTSKSPAVRSAAASAIARLTSAHAPHTNCARSFLRLYETERPEANALYARVRDYLDSVS